MFAYLAKRILAAVPMVFFISFVAYWLSMRAPNELFGSQISPPDAEVGVDGVRMDWDNYERKLESLIQRHNFHLPLFYFRIGSLAEPDTIFNIINADKRRLQLKWLWRSGKWENVQAYFNTIKQLEWKHTQIQLEIEKDHLFEANQEIQHSLELVRAIQASLQPTVLIDSLDKHIQQGKYLHLLHPNISQIRKAFAQLNEDNATWRLYIPTLFWYGSNNQYHHWLANLFLHQNFGYSIRNRQPVHQRIYRLIPWSLVLGVSSILIAFLLSIPIGIFMARYHSSKLDRVGRIFFLALDAIPNFFLASMLLLLFANPDIFDWFPSSFNLSRQHEMNFWIFAKTRFGTLLLPLIAYTYGSLAFLSRQMRASLLEVSRKNYILAARAKGLSENRIWSVHILRNALMPMVTLIASVFPAMIGGSIILEKIFGIPGMGLEAFLAVMSKDVHMIVAISTITGFLTILGYIVSDLLSLWIDPRIKLDTHSK